MSPTGLPRHFVSSAGCASLQDWFTAVGTLGPFAARRASLLPFCILPTLVLRQLYQAKHIHNLALACGVGAQIKGPAIATLAASARIFYGVVPNHAHVGVLYGASCCFLVLSLPYFMVHHIVLLSLEGLTASEEPRRRLEGRKCCTCKNRSWAKTAVGISIS